MVMVETCNLMVQIIQWSKAFFWSTQKVTPGGQALPEVCWVEVLGVWAIKTMGKRCGYRWLSMSMMTGSIFFGGYLWLGRCFFFERIMGFHLKIPGIAGCSSPKIDPNMEKQGVLTHSAHSNNMASYLGSLKWGRPNHPNGWSFLRRDPMYPDFQKHPYASSGFVWKYTVSANPCSLASKISKISKNGWV